MFAANPRQSTTHDFMRQGRTLSWSSAAADQKSAPKMEVWQMEWTKTRGKTLTHTHMAMGEKPVPPVNIPIPTKTNKIWVVHRKPLKWYQNGFDNHSHMKTRAQLWTMETKIVTSPHQSSSPVPRSRRTKSRTMLCKPSNLGRKTPSQTAQGSVCCTVFKWCGSTSLPLF